jgi:hypothetical protein
MPEPATIGRGGLSRGRPDRRDFHMAGGPVRWTSWIGPLAWEEVA